MGLASDLGYAHPKPNLIQRGFQRLGSTSWGAKMFSLSLRHLDDVVKKLSRGRTSAPAVLAGLSVLDVTTTGRKSGQKRTSHLIAIPYGETVALLGTNFGGASTPAWVFNLEADPHATVTYKNRTVNVVARAAEPAEADQVWTDSARFYGGYQKYQQRITGRDVRVFILEPARPSAA